VFFGWALKLPQLGLNFKPENPVAPSGEVDGTFPEQ
jgi:hypothetical protein